MDTARTTNARCPAPARSPASDGGHVGYSIRATPRGSEWKVDAPTRARVLGGSFQRNYPTCAVHTVDVRFQERTTTERRLPPFECVYTRGSNTTGCRGTRFPFIFIFIIVVVVTSDLLLAAWRRQHVWLIIVVRSGGKSRDGTRRSCHCCRNEFSSW